jgi:hypothetical protein
MSGATQTPPRWAEALLECLLPEHVRETVVGDLREEFVESALQRKGLLRARLWYLRQVASFVPWFTNEGPPMGKFLVLVSCFTLACASWLAVMETVLRHPGYVARIGTALVIAAICVTTILVRMLHAGIRCERWLWLGAVALIALGVMAFFRNVNANHFEGFVFVISLVLIVQGVLMLANLGRAHGGSPRSFS